MYKNLYDHLLIRETVIPRILLTTKIYFLFMFSFLILQTSVRKIPLVTKSTKQFLCTLLKHRSMPPKRTDCNVFPKINSCNFKHISCIVKISTNKSASTVFFPSGFMFYLVLKSILLPYANKLNCVTFKFMFTRVQRYRQIYLQCIT